MKIFMFRHGETNLNVDGLIKGQAIGMKTEFTPKGEYQIQNVAKFLKENGVEAIFSSDIVRAQETANIILKSISCPLFVSPIFRGLNVGIFKGQKKKEFEQSEEVKRAFSDYNYAIPGGESVNQLISRILDGFKSIRDNYQYQKVCVVSHGAAISNIKSFLANESFQRIEYCFLSSSEETWQVEQSGQYQDLFN